MYCYHCGKELSPDAVMCPECGAPTKNMKVDKVADEVKAPVSSHAVGLSVVALTLSLIAFVTGIIFGAFFYVYYSSQLLLMVISATTILPAIVSL